MLFTLKYSNLSNLQKFFSVGSSELADLQFAITGKAHSIAWSHMRTKEKTGHSPLNFIRHFSFLLKELST